MQPEGINPINTNPLASSGMSTRDIDPLVKLIATRLGVSEFTAFSVLRKFMGTAQASTFTEIQSFMTDFLKSTDNQRQVNELAKDLQGLEQKPGASEENFKPIISRLQYGFNENRETQARTLEQDRFVGSRQASNINPNDATALVKSPKLFASWLINNKAAFISLKSNQEVTSLLLALQNPQLQKSPVLLSQMSILIAQLLKLKAGKSLTEDVDEVRKEASDKDSLTDSFDHEASIVSNVKASTASTPVSALRDFLLEAERFAEEEIANLWSITLKKEKELENKLKDGFKEFKKKKDK